MQEANTSPLSMSTQSALSRLKSIEMILPTQKLRTDTPSFGHCTGQLTFEKSPLCGKAQNLKTAESSEIRPGPWDSNRRGQGPARGGRRPGSRRPYRATYALVLAQASRDCFLNSPPPHGTSNEHRDWEFEHGDRGMGPPGNGAGKEKPAAGLSSEDDMGGIGSGPGACLCYRSGGGARSTQFRDADSKHGPFAAGWSGEGTQPPDKYGQAAPGRILRRNTTGFTHGTAQ